MNDVGLVGVYNMNNLFNKAHKWYRAKNIFILNLY